MALFFRIHPDNPQRRLLVQAESLLQRGGVLALPTDTSYSLVCRLDDKAAGEHMRRIRHLDEKQLLAILCRDLGELANYARVDNAQFRLLKLGTPGPYTFILNASKQVPRRLSQPQRKTIGLRVPDHRVAQGLLEVHGAPLLATTLILPAEEDEGPAHPLNDPQVIRERLDSQLAGIIDAGTYPVEPSTVVDLTATPPRILRHGLGDPARLGL